MVRFRATLTAVVTLLSSITADAKDADTTASFFTDDERVATLTRASFISSVLESRTPALVWFYSGSECTSCDPVADVIQAAAEKLTAWGLYLAAVNLDGQGRLAKEIGAMGSPITLNVYFGSSTPNPYGGLPVRSHQGISTLKDARDLQRQILSMIPDMVTSVDLSAMSGADDDGEVAKKAVTLREAVHGGGAKYTAVLVTSAGKSSPLLRVLASELSGDVNAVQVRVPKFDDRENMRVDSLDDAVDQSQQLVSRVLVKALDVLGGIPSLPAVVLVNKERSKSVLFPGNANDAKAIRDFVLTNAEMSSSSSPEAGNTGNASQESSSKAGIIGGVLQLDPERLVTLAEGGVEALVVAVVNGDEGIEEIIPGWSTATKGLQGQIRAAVLDCLAYPAAPPCEGDTASGKTKLPYIRVYPHTEGAAGNTRRYPSIFAASQVDEAVKEADESLPEVVTVIPLGMGPERTHDAVNGFVGTALFGNGQTGALIVMSKREEPNLLVRTVANQVYHYGIRTVFVSQPPQEVLAQLSITKVPAMMMVFKAPEDSPQQQFHEDGRPVDPSEKAMVTATYSQAQWGPLTHRSAVEFVLSQLSRASTEMFMKALTDLKENVELTGETLPAQIEMILEQWDAQEGTERESSPREHGAPSEKPLSFRGVPEVSAEAWEATMKGDATGGSPPRIVGVFLLDRFAEGFDSALKAAETAVARAEGDQSLYTSGAQFFWADAPCQDGFSKALGISDAAEVPVLTVYSPKHVRSGRYVGAWEAESMASYLKQAIGGRAPMFPVDGEIRLDTSDCSQRLGAGTGGEAEGAGDIEDEDMGDFMAEILAEEAKAKRELEEAVAKDMEELKEQEEARSAEEAKPKRRTKIVKKKKKKKTSSKGGTDGEL